MGCSRGAVGACQYEIIKLGQGDGDTATTLFSRAVGCCSTAGPSDTTSVLNALAATVTSPVMSC